VLTAFDAGSGDGMNEVGLGAHLLYLHGTEHSAPAIRARAPRWKRSAPTVAVPLGAENTSGTEAVDTWPTRWATVVDLTHDVYYVMAVNSPAVFWVDFGKTARGYIAVTYAEHAHLGGTRRTEATGLGTAVMFAGVLLIPPGFGAAVAGTGDHALAYMTLAILALASAVLLCSVWRHADTAP
jgi:hypothetical protein